MNRTNDKHFFYCWDLAKKLEQACERKPKETEYLQSVEEYLYSEGGFYSGTPYQEAIFAYQNNLRTDEL